MRARIILLGVFVLLATSCNGAVIERIRDDDARPTPTAPSNGVPAQSTQSQQVRLQPESSSVAINGRAFSEDDLRLLRTAYDLTVGPGSYWYDPVSGAWGYWGGPTAGFMQPYMELGYAPLNASGGGTGVVLNGRELHPVDLAGLQQLLGYIYPGYYWLDANGNFGFEGGQALGNLIYTAQGAGSNGGGGGAYYDSTYFGNIGSDGQNSYFYDSSTGCSVMSDGGVSC